MVAKYKDWNAVGANEYGVSLQDAAIMLLMHGWCFTKLYDRSAENWI